jgi:hypothetical protein
VLTELLLGVLCLEVVALLELGREALCVLILVVGFAELLEEELLDRDTPLFELVLGLVLLFTVELVLLLLGAVCVIVGLVLTACLELVLGFELLDELVAVLEYPLLFVAGLVEIPFLL